MDRRILLQQVETHVRQLFENTDTSFLLYHNFNHTKLVVERVSEIAGQHELSIHSEFVLLVAAWFHDTGLLSGEPNQHEQRSVQIMKDFFIGKNIGDATIENITQTILSTKLPVLPITQLDKIICDADNWDTGTADFHRLFTFAWHELQLEKKRGHENMVEESLRYLESYPFYTDYCIRKLSSGRKMNIELLKLILLKDNTSPARYPN